MYKRILWPQKPGITLALRRYGYSEGKIESVRLFRKYSIIEGCYTFFSLVCHRNAAGIKPRTIGGEYRSSIGTRRRTKSAVSTFKFQSAERIREKI